MGHKSIVKNFQTVSSVHKIGKMNSTERKVVRGQLQTVRTNRILRV